ANRRQVVGVLWLRQESGDDRRARQIDEQAGRMRGRCGRQTQDEDAPLAGFASFHDQRPTMALGELTADEQPEPSPRLRAEVGIVDPVEALEDLLLLVPWNSDAVVLDRKSTRLNSSHRTISYAVFCLKKKSS